MEGLRVRVPQRKLVRAPAVDGATARADDALDDEVPLAASESAGESSDELS